MNMKASRRGLFGILAAGFSAAVIRTPGLVMPIKPVRVSAPPVLDDAFAAWNAQKAAWRAEAAARLNLAEALPSARRAIDLLVPRSERVAFDEMLNTTGVGDHPAMIALLARAGRIL